LSIVDRAHKLDTLWFFSEFGLEVLECSHNTRSKSLTILLLGHQERSTNKVKRVNGWHRRILLPMIRRVMTRLDDGFQYLVVIQWIKAKVPTLRVNRRSDVGAVYDFASIFGQNFVSHGVSNVFCDADPIPTFLT
jgi:hypothetical protein